MSSENAIPTLAICLAFASSAIYTKRKSTVALIIGFRTNKNNGLTFGFLILLKLKRKSKAGEVQLCEDSLFNFADLPTEPYPIRTQERMQYVVL